eukprot:6733201-Lingulodinium_polyedra.AAC.1
MNSERRLKRHRVASPARAVATRCCVASCLPGVQRADAQNGAPTSVKLPGRVCLAGRAPIRAA